MPKAGAVAASDAAAPALHKIERAAIAASTHITYKPQELLTLIKQHLEASGLTETARQLEREANLCGSSHNGAGLPSKASLSEEPAGSLNTLHLPLLITETSPV